jgi:hypothetical protein
MSISENIEKLIGSSWWDVIQLLYLMGKYRNSCIFLPVNIEPISSEVYQTFTSHPWGNFIALSWYCDKKCRLKAPSIFAKKNGEEVGFYKYTKMLRECIEASSRMTVIPIELVTPSSGHANMLIYDKLTHSLERYEPHGQVTPSKFNPELLDTQLEKFFSVVIPNSKKLEYFPPSSYCPRHGPQLFEKISREKLGVPIKKGFCSVWSFVYANYRLRFPDKKRDVIATYLSESIRKKEEVYTFVERVILMLAWLSEAIKSATTIEEIQNKIMEATTKLGKSF